MHRHTRSRCWDSILKYRKRTITDKFADLHCGILPAYSSPRHVILHARVRLVPISHPGLDLRCTRRHHSFHVRRCLRAVEIPIPAMMASCDHLYLLKRRPPRRPAGGDRCRTPGIVLAVHKEQVIGMEVPAIVVAVDRVSSRIEVTGLIVGCRE